MHFSRNLLTKVYGKCLPDNLVMVQFTVNQFTDSISH